MVKIKLRVVPNLFVATPGKLSSPCPWRSKETAERRDLARSKILGSAISCGKWIIKLWRANAQLSWSIPLQISWKRQWHNHRRVKSKWETIILKVLLNVSIGEWVIKWHLSKRRTLPKEALHWQTNANDKDRNSQAIQTFSTKGLPNYRRMNMNSKSTMKSLQLNWTLVGPNNI